MGLSALISEWGTDEFAQWQTSFSPWRTPTMQEDPQYKQEEKRPLTLQDSGAAPPSAAPARTPGSNLCYVAFACGV